MTGAVHEGGNTPDWKPWHLIVEPAISLPRDWNLRSQQDSQTLLAVLNTTPPRWAPGHAARLPALAQLDLGDNLTCGHSFSASCEQPV